MKSIYKYPIAIVDEQEVFIPKGSKVLSAIEQNDEIVLYALVEADEQVTTKLKVIIHGTGHPANDVEYFEFLGSVKIRGNMFVFHVFCKQSI